MNGSAQSTASGRIVLRDTTLREGIQIPGSRVSEEHKQRFVTLLDEMGVPEAEIGLPDGAVACADLAEFVRAQGLAIRPSALVPCYVKHWRRQVDIAADRGVRIDVLAPVSDHLLEPVEHYGLAADQIVPRLGEVIGYAAGRGVSAGAALIDACRAPVDRLLAIARSVEGLGAARLVIYDSVGTMLPWRMGKLVAAVRGTTPVPLLAHCHNDHGLATANTLAALEAGASAADVAVNGLGGRAGNAALEEVAMALETLCGRPSGVDLRRLCELSAFVEGMTGLSNGPLKPIVGRYCFAHAPVMHIRCIAAGRAEAFEPFDPRRVGAKRRYDFCLPVDYTAALEPFLRRCGGSVSPEQVPALVALLRTGPPMTEREVLDCIRDFQAGRRAHAARTD